MACETLSVYHWNGSGWDAQTTTGHDCIGALNFVTAVNVTDFSPFVLRSPDSPTAVTLHSLSVISAGNRTMALPVMALLLLITGAVLWHYSRRHPKSIR